MMISETDRVCLLEIEAVYGVAEAMTSADAILLMNSKIAPAADKLERVTDKGFFGGNPFVLVGKRITLTGECDILGNPTPGLAAPLGKLYRICSHSETLVAADAGPPAIAAEAIYRPISRGIASATVDFFWGGMRFRMLGTRGYFDRDYSAKSYAKGSLTLTGLLTMPVDEDMPAGIDWDAFQTPAAIETESWEVIVDGANVCAQQLMVSSNATINVVECSEGRQVMVTNRTPGGTLKVFKDALLSIWNPFEIAESHAIITLENTITKAAGLNVRDNLRVQLELPQPEAIEGQAGFSIPFSCVPTGAGGDEYEIGFT